jgi:hypothetical protein
MKSFIALCLLMISSVVGAQTIPPTADVPPGGRLTINRGVAEMRADVVGATKIWYAPSVSGKISIYGGSGTGFVTVPFIASLNDKVGLELPLDPSWATANTVFDAYITSNPPVLCAVPWTNPPPPVPPAFPTIPQRVTPLDLVGGQTTNSATMPCQGPTGAFSMLQYQGVFVGKFWTNAAGVIDFKFGNAALGGGAARVSISNAYNKVPGTFAVQDTASSWSAQTTPNISGNISGWEPLNLPCAGCSGGQHNNIAMITDGGKVEVTLNMGIYPNVGANLYIGVSLDGVMTPVLAGVWSKCANGLGGPTGTSSIFHQAVAICAGYPTEGPHVLQAMEMGTSGSSSGQLYSDQGGVTQLGGLTARWEW